MKHSDILLKNSIIFFMLSTFLTVPILIPPSSGFSTSTSMSFPSTEFIIPNVDTLGYSFSSQSVIDSTGVIHTIYSFRNSTGVYLDPVTYEVMYLSNQSGDWSDPISIFTSDKVVTCTDLQVDSQLALHAVIHVAEAGNRYLQSSTEILNRTWTDVPIGTLGGISGPAFLEVDSSDQALFVYNSSLHVYSDNLYVAYQNYSSIETFIQNSTYIDNLYNSTSNSTNFNSTQLFCSNFTTFADLSSISNPRVSLDVNGTAHILFEANWDQYGQSEEIIHDVFYTSYTLFNQTTIYDESVNSTDPVENSTYYIVNTTNIISTTQGYFSDFVCLSDSLVNGSAAYPNIIISTLGNLHMAWIQETNESIWEIVYQTYGSLPLPTIFEGVPKEQKRFNISVTTALRNLNMAIDCPTSEEVLHFQMQGSRNYSSDFFVQTEISELMYFQNSSGSFVLETISNGYQEIGDTSFFIHPIFHTAGVTYLSTLPEGIADIFIDQQERPYILQILEQRSGYFGTHFNASAILEGKYVTSQIRTNTYTDNSTEEMSVVSIEDARKSVLRIVLANTHNQSRDFNMNIEFQSNSLIRLSSLPNPDSSHYTITHMTPQENRILEWEFLLGEGDVVDLAVQFYTSEIFLGEFVFHVEIEIRFKVSITIFIFGGLLLLFSGLYWHYQKKF